jgi:CDGSH-type Zn-finger protein
MHTVEIKSTENGPNLVCLDGKVLTALCRCGGSNNKPFCDGTHAKNGFHAKPADLKVLTEHSKVEA